MGWARGSVGMHMSRLIGGGLGVVLAIALGAAGSVSPLVSPDRPASRPQAAMAQIASHDTGARIVSSPGHAPLIAWSE